MQLEKLKEIVINALENLKAIDVVVLDVHKLTTVTDLMVICSGRSSRHVVSIADSVIQAAKKNGCQPLGVEGKKSGEWLLVDLGDIVVHIMLADTREFYQLEKLWG
jgi:ribosome-associated protein